MIAEHVWSVLFDHDPMYSPVTRTLVFPTAGEQARRVFTRADAVLSLTARRRHPRPGRGPQARYVTTG